MKRSLEERIGKDGKTHVERTDGYSNNLDALRWEFGIDSKGTGSQYGPQHIVAITLQTIEGLSKADNMLRVRNVLIEIQASTSHNVPE